MLTELYCMETDDMSRQTSKRFSVWSDNSCMQVMQLHGIFTTCLCGMVMFSAASVCLCACLTLEYIDLETLVLLCRCICRSQNIQYQGHEVKIKENTCITTKYTHEGGLP